MTVIFNLAQSKDLRKKLRNNRPKPEIKLWYYTRNKQLGCKFRRKVGIGEYIVDFYSPEIKLVIEIDGESHYNQQEIEKDKTRDLYLHGLGLKVLRFTNLEVMENIEGVILKIKEITSPSPSF